MLSVGKTRHPSPNVLLTLNVSLGPAQRWLKLITLSVSESWHHSPNVLLTLSVSLGHAQHGQNIALSGPAHAQRGLKSSTFSVRPAIYINVQIAVPAAYSP